MATFSPKVSPIDKTILAVDDDMTILAACSESLMLDGYLVDIAESGEKAVELLQKKKYDLVVSDLIMGELGGLDVLMSAKETSPETEVILLTAHGNVGSAVEAMKLGAYDYLMKPFKPYELRITIQRAIEHQELLRKMSGLKETIDLYHATRLVSRIRDSKELFQTLARLACELSHSSGGTILSVSPDEKNLTIESAHGVRHGILLGQTLPYDKARVARLNADDLHSLDTVEARKSFQFEKVPGFGDIVFSLSVPIFYHDRPLAVLNLCRVGNEMTAYTEEELPFITIFVAQAGYAIENSRLYQSFEILKNKETFKNQLEICLSLQTLPEFKSLSPDDKKKIQDLIDLGRRLMEQK